MLWKSNKQKLREAKERVLFEVGQDLNYIKYFKSKDLDYDETKARKRFAELKRNENRSNAEEQEYFKLEEEITNSRAVKAEYEKLETLRNELIDYISLLKD